jgi:drug/metabolite transporter (DMT)-like permease
LNIQTRPLKGIALIILATLAFACGDVLTKHLAIRYPVAMVIGVRYFINLTLLTLALWPSMRGELWRVQRLGLVCLRGICLAMGSFTMGLALQVMPLGETVAIIYLAPFIVLLLSPYILEERVTLAGWTSAVLGFCGVMMILRPGGGLAPWGVTMALVNVGFGAAYFLLTRLLSRSETTIAMLWHTALIGTIGFGTGSMFTPLIRPVTGQDIWLFLGLGLLATIGHFLFTAAYREAPPSRLAPISYLHLVWAAGLGWAVFDHLPDYWAFLGMASVIAAGAWSATLRDA